MLGAPLGALIPGGKSRVEILNSGTDVTFERGSRSRQKLLRAAGASRRQRNGDNNGRYGGGRLKFHGVVAPLPRLSR